MIYLVVVKFLIFVSEVVSIFSKILTWIIWGAKGYLCPNPIIGGVRAPAAPLSLRLSHLSTTSKLESRRPT